MSGISNRFTINGTANGSEVTKPEVKPGTQPGKQPEKKTSDTAKTITLPFSSGSKQGAVDWFQQKKGWSVTVIDNNHNGQLDPQDIFPKDSKVTTEQIKNELNEFATYVNNVVVSDKDKLQEFLQTKYGEAFIIDDQDKARGGNGNQKIDPQELVFADTNIKAQEVLQEYQLSKISPATTEDKTAMEKSADSTVDGAQKDNATGKSFNGSVVLGVNVDKPNPITAKTEGTAFVAGDFGFPIKDFFTIRLAGLVTSNPANINKSITQRQMIEGNNPGGFALNKLVSDFVWQTKGASPIISFGFLPNYAKNWLEGTNFKYFPTTNKDNLERIIENDRLGVGFGVNKLFNIDKFSNFPSVFELNTKVSGGPYFPRGIFDNNKLKDNIGYWVEAVGSIRNLWQFKDIAALEYGMDLGINSKGYTVDSKRKNDVSTSFNQALAANFFLGKGWELRFGSEFGQKWQIVTNDQRVVDKGMDKVVKENGFNLILPLGYDQKSFTHSYRPFLGVITPYLSKFGQLELNLIGKFDLLSMKTHSIWSNNDEGKVWNYLSTNTSRSEMGFALEFLWNKLCGLDWLSLGMNGGLTESIYNYYNVETDGYDKVSKKWGHFTLYLKFKL